ncbi:MAG TPA: sulfotransferase [Candidatus Micrarchaeaceae archaeon]|nr:sulfotransferase [Candidatus Micrarchaeaceae archaeon]
MTEPVTIGAAIITRDRLAKLKELLDQVSGLDQVVVVDTGSRDGTRAYVKKLGPPFELHEFKWRPRPAGFGPDDWGFAAARNESFGHLRTTHALWLDSDDMVVHVAEGKRIRTSSEATAAAFRRLASASTELDVWMVDYLLRTDEFGNPSRVIAKERLVRQPDTWRWRFPVHEVLVSQRKEVRDLNTVVVLDIGVVHRQGDAGRSISRNARMLKAWLRQLQTAGGPDADLARARFLVGRSLFAQGQFAKAANWMLGQFLAKHPHVMVEEKWEGWMEVAKSLVPAGDTEGARQATLQAIGLCPRFGEAYVMLADLKNMLGERPADIIKLLEVAQSCGSESYGTHEHNPLLTGLHATLLASENQVKLDNYREALGLADRALAAHPGNPRARQAWERAAGAAQARLAEPSPDPAISTVASPGPDEPRGAAPVFVVSSGRCGSTLLSNMLRLHPDILSLSEFLIMLMPGAFAGAGPIQGPQFWAMLSTPRKRMTMMYRLGIPFDEVLYRPGPGTRFTAETGVPPILLTALPHLTTEPEALYDEIHDYVLAQGSYSVGQHYVRLFDWLRQRFDRKVWVERSGSILVNLDELMANFPDARFIHMYRDGRECAISMSHHSAFRLSMISADLTKHLGADPYSTDEPTRGDVPPELQKLMPDTFDLDAFWKYETSIDGLGASWAGQEAHGISLLAQLPPGRVLQLRYEDLVSRPASELSNLMRFLGLPEPADSYLRSAASLVKVKPPAWPQLPVEQRKRLDDVCRFAMGLLYGAEALTPGSAVAE